MPKHNTSAYMALLDSKTIVFITDIVEWCIYLEWFMKIPEKKFLHKLHKADR